MEYTELGPKYRPCEAMELDFSTMRGFMKVFISPLTPEAIVLSGADHCRVCQYFSVMYHTEVIRMQLENEEW